MAEGGRLVHPIRRTDMGRRGRSRGGDQDRAGSYVRQETLLTVWRGATGGNVFSRRGCPGSGRSRGGRGGTYRGDYGGDCSGHGGGLRNAHYSSKGHPRGGGEQGTAGDCYTGTGKRPFASNASSPSQRVTSEKSSRAQINDSFFRSIIFLVTFSKRFKEGLGLHRSGGVWCRQESQGEDPTIGPSIDLKRSLGDLLAQGLNLMVNCGELSKRLRPQSGTEFLQKVDEWKTTQGSTGNGCSEILDFLLSIAMMLNANGCFAIRKGTYSFRVGLCAERQTFCLRYDQAPATITSSFFLEMDEQTPCSGDFLSVGAEQLIVVENPSSRNRRTFVIRAAIFLAEQNEHIVVYWQNSQWVTIRPLLSCEARKLSDRDNPEGWKPVVLLCEKDSCDRGL